MLGGKEDCDAMILAQNEMIKLERDYYKEESIKFAFYFSVIFFVVIMGLTFYVKMVSV
jgi:hypothetical protein